MPVVTRARVGLIERTGGFAREKLRIPAAASAKPIRISEPPMIQTTKSIPRNGNGKGSMRSKTKPSRSAARKRRGGLAMTPAVPVSFTRCPAGSIFMSAPADAGGREVGRRAGSKAEAITVLMLEVAQCFFKIRALGQKAGFITSWGGGAFGFMRSLALLGPLTVPQIAQMRPTSRQRMQRLANELWTEGLVEFIDNPKHRRSKLVQLTPKGDA